MQAVIIAVGDELISGAIVDTNTAYLARRLGERGIATVRHVTVGDDEADIAVAIAAAAAEADVVLVTGGIGPTVDDLSRHGLARAMGVELREDPRQAERIAARFASFGREMKPSNRVQALVPVGAAPIDNDCGTAPGLAATIGEARIFITPGVPREMEAMFEEKIFPQLAGAGAVARRLIHTYGSGESNVGEVIADLMARGLNPAVGTTAKDGVITVRINATGDSAEAAGADADATAAEVRRRLGELVFGEGEQTLPAVVGELLAAAGATLATAESCTGGLVGEMITAVSGSSRYYLGGAVTYANAAKVDLAGVDAALIERHGAVSEPVAEAMAVGIRRRLGADWGVATTGIAGPTGGTDEKPVGLVVMAVAGPAGCEVHRRSFPGGRDVVRHRAAVAVLGYLRLALIGRASPP